MTSSSSQSPSSPSSTSEGTGTPDVSLWLLRLADDLSETDGFRDDAIRLREFAITGSTFESFPPRRALPSPESVTTPAIDTRADLIANLGFIDRDLYRAGHALPSSVWLRVSARLAAELIAPSSSPSDRSPEPAPAMLCECGHDLVAHDNDPACGPFTCSCIQYRPKSFTSAASGEPSSVVEEVCHRVEEWEHEDDMRSPLT